MSKTYGFKVKAVAVEIDEAGIEREIFTSEPINYRCLGYENLVTVESAYASAVATLCDKLVNAGFTWAVAKGAISQDDASALYRATAP